MVLVRRTPLESGLAQLVAAQTQNTFSTEGGPGPFCLISVFLFSAHFIAPKTEAIRQMAKSVGRDEKEIRNGELQAAHASQSGAKLRRIKLPKSGPVHDVVTRVMTAGILVFSTCSFFGGLLSRQMASSLSLGSHSVVVRPRHAKL